MSRSLVHVHETKPSRLPIAVTLRLDSKRLLGYVTDQRQLQDGWLSYRVLKWLEYTCLVVKYWKMFKVNLCFRNSWPKNTPVKLVISSIWYSTDVTVKWDWLVSWPINYYGHAAISHPSNVCVYPGGYWFGVLLVVVPYLDSILVMFHFTRVSQWHNDHRQFFLSLIIFFLSTELTFTFDLVTPYEVTEREI